MGAETWATNNQDLGPVIQPDPQEAARLAAEGVKRAEDQVRRAREEYERALGELRRAKVWLRYNEQLTDETRMRWVSWGAPDFWQNFWQLGYDPDHVVYSSAGPWHTPTMTIPIFDVGWQCVNVCHRLLNPPAPHDKYRPERSGLPAALFMADMGEAELRVTPAVIRGTFGYHRGEVEMSMSKMQEMTGMSYNGVEAGATLAEKRGTIERVHRGGKSTIWRAIVSPAPSPTEGGKKRAASVGEGGAPQQARETSSVGEGQLGLNKYKEREINDSGEAKNASPRAAASHKQGDLLDGMLAFQQKPGSIDGSQYPESVADVLAEFCKLWGHRLPEKPKNGRGGSYAAWVQHHPQHPGAGQRGGDPRPQENRRLIL